MVKIPVVQSVEDSYERKALEEKQSFKSRVKDAMKLSKQLVQDDVGESRVRR